MNFHPAYFSRFLFSLSFFALLSACAPQQGDPEPEPEPAGVAEGGTTALESGPATEPADPVDPVEEPSPVEIPDWEERYRELHREYAEEFKGPEIGDAVRLEQKDGRHQPGWVHRITDDEIVLDTGAGLSNFRLEDLSEASAMANLRSVYARKQAYDQGMKEFEVWKKANPEAARALPTPGIAPEPTRQPIPEPDPVIHESAGGNEYPFRVEPDGRVPHVEDYIRKNAAFPDSLQVRTWWPVKPHDRGGYQVRVRYTLKSAGNLGTSYEDMIFFMYANGRIHQRAPVK